MTYHYHFLGTYAAVKDVQEFITVRTTDRTLKLDEKDLYMVWELSKVEYTPWLDATIRIVEALYHNLLLHVVTRADDTLLAELTPHQHSNFDAAKNASIRATWDHRMKQPDSIFQIQRDLESLEGHLEVLKHCHHKSYYAPLIEAVEVMTGFIGCVILDDRLHEGEEEADDAIAPLEEIKRMIQEVNAEEKAHSAYLHWPFEVKRRVYGAILWRLARIAYHKGLPYVEYNLSR